ncbi:MAG: glycoside hydrolase family 9 protein [Chitinispirillaceae bacterium]|nr:glycoside hydrolase family 9 protein [Chitinispirillaceae bacterium]
MVFVAKNIRTFSTLAAAAVIIAGGAVSTVSAAVQIKLNQLGFYPEAPKRAVAVGATSDSFHVAKQDGGTVVYSGVLGSAATWSASGEEARIADFSELETPGSYVVQCAGCDDSYPFSISGKVHLGLAKGVVKGLYFNRCSFALTEPFAGVYARAAGHPDTAVEVHPGAASGSRPAGTKLSCPGGWYDAGDYNKYIVNSGISTYSMFAAYEAFPAFYDTLTIDLPESGNDLPDLLDEALYNLHWMLTMQDPEDGGVYHKLTTAGFAGMVMPDEATDTRYVVAKSTTATLDFAAVCAQAARIFRKFETVLPGFADSCLAASLHAWEWARANPAVAYQNRNMTNPAVSTGEYGDRNPADELLWAATELFIATKQDSFFTVAFPGGNLTGVSSIPSWPTVGTLGLYSLFLCKEQLATVSAEKIRNALAALADSTMKIIAENPYHIGMRDRDFNWGSNSGAANRGMSLLLGYLAEEDTVYRAAALDMLDYLLGRNPTGYSYVTGFGSRTPMHIHHRVSEADSIEAPVPGFLAGGPNPGMQDITECGEGSYPSNLPATAYYDNVCSYASNEIAINWNTPLVFLAGGIEALYGSEDPDPVVRGSKKKPGAASGIIRLQGKNLLVEVPLKNKVTVTVATLQGRVLRRLDGAGRITVAADWPLQTILVTVAATSSADVDKSPILQRLTVAGGR